MRWRKRLFCMLVASTITSMTIAEPTTEPNAADAAAGTRQPVQNPLSIREFVDTTESLGLPLVDVTRHLQPEFQNYTLEYAQFNGAKRARILRKHDANAFVAVWEFDDLYPLDLCHRHYSGSIRYRNLLIQPAECDEYSWSAITDALINTGGGIQVAQSAEIAMTRSMLMTLQAQIELFKFKFDRVPDFEQRGWDDLMDHKFLAQEPVSYITQCPEKTKLIILAESGQTGADVEISQAAWAWNSADQMMYIAGYSEQRMQELLDDREDVHRKLVVIQSKYAVTGPEWAKDAVVKYKLGTTRNYINEFFFVQTTESQSAYPTYQQLCSEANSQLLLGMNPYNGNHTIQPATWNPNNPPVFGEAGWNYDETNGRFWPNTALADANKL
jgi:hypothetical protein